MFNIRYKSMTQNRLKIIEDLIHIARIMECVGQHDDLLKYYRRFSTCIESNS